MVDGDETEELLDQSARFENDILSHVRGSVCVGDAAGAGCAVNLGGDYSRRRSIGPSGVVPRRNCYTPAAPGAAAVWRRPSLRSPTSHWIAAVASDISTISTVQ